VVLVVEVSVLETRRLDLEKKLVMDVQVALMDEEIRDVFVVVVVVVVVVLVEEVVHDDV